jgi:hypothetical protein
MTMMKNWISRRGWLAGGVALGLSVATAWAAENLTVDQFVPGVNALGNLDDTLGATIPVKVSLNTLKGRFTAVGQGTVGNLYVLKKNSKSETLRFTNPKITFSLPPGASVMTSDYKVSQKGKCVLHAAGTFSADPI